MSDSAVRVVGAFQHADADGNGVISKDELLDVLMELDPDGEWNPQKVRSLVRAIDYSGDGFIQYEEFIAWLFSPDTCGETKARMQVDLGWEVVRPAVVLKEPNRTASKGGKIVQRREGGRILVFFDVDGVLNTQAEFRKLEDAEWGIDVSGLEKAIQDPDGRWAARVNRDCLARLKRLINSFDEVTDGVTFNRARLVLSSTMRLSEDQLNFVKWALKESGIEKGTFIGCTASLPQASRGEEILHYVTELTAAGRYVSAWVVLDSDTEGLKCIEEIHRVETGDIDGLDDEAAKQARRTLVEQDKSWHTAHGGHRPIYGTDFELDSDPVRMSVASPFARGPWRPPASNFPRLGEVDGLGRNTRAEPRKASKVARQSSLGRLQGPATAGPEAPGEANATPTPSRARSLSLASMSRRSFWGSVRQQAPGERPQSGRQRGGEGPLSARRGSKESQVSIGDVDQAARARQRSRPTSASRLDSIGGKSRDPLDTGAFQSSNAREPPETRAATNTSGEAVVRRAKSERPEATAGARAQRLLYKQKSRTIDLLQVPEDSMTAQPWESSRPRSRSDVLALAAVAGEPSGSAAPKRSARRRTTMH